MENSDRSTDHYKPVLIRKVFTSREPPFNPELDFEKYTMSSIENRRAHILDTCEIVEEDEQRKKIDSHYAVEEKIHKDPELRQNVEIFPRAGGDTKLSSICGVLCTRAMLSQGRPKNAKIKKVEFEINDETRQSLLKYHPVYTPPKERILLMPNLTFNAKEVIPVYSDVPEENVDNIEIPDSLLFDYTDVNFVNPSAEKELSDAVKLANSDKLNVIRCNCCSEENIVPCYENQDCNCYLLNDLMQDHQKYKSEKTKFTTFDPIYLTGKEGLYGKHYGFSCSELCACKGNCTNNSLLIIEKKLFPLEVFRNDMNMGFSVRSSVLIPGGTPIMEFTGEICRYKNETSDYSYQITYPGDKDIISIFSAVCFTDEYKKTLTKLHKRKWYIDPRYHGNVARMACHSCSANMELFRIFQKSLSPAHIRLVLVAMLDIYPGTPLTFDYGHAYVHQRFRDNCGCRSFVCANGEDAEVYTKLTEKEFQDCYIELDKHQWLEWDEKVYGAVWNERNKAKEAEMARSENEEDEHAVVLD
ncbi:hypothetical protein CAEBREN_22667 [Caenorhabditis brenneri]|uniref:SET domain-containing protein n=1 Tax=Caenorhabditis brenneri TaxID=135651 RepID=G0PCT9_CAEBE|nr:hypothetical protein CAEBREN_22667 [Caenorhabditis brenneri]